MELTYHEGIIRRIAADISSALSEMFDMYTVSEWLEQKILPLQLKLHDIRKQAELLNNLKSWPARPISPSAELWLHDVAKYKSLKEIKK